MELPLEPAVPRVAMRRTIEDGSQRSQAGTAARGPCVRSVSASGAARMSAQPRSGQRRAQELESLRSRHRPREQVTLHRVAVLLREELPLLLRLDPFGDHIETERAPECDRRTAKRRIV